MSGIYRPLQCLETPTEPENRVLRAFVLPEWPQGRFVTENALKAELEPVVSKTDIEMLKAKIETLDANQTTRNTLLLDWRNERNLENFSWNDKSEEIMKGILQDSNVRHKCRSVASIASIALCSTN